MKFNNPYDFVPVDTQQTDTTPLKWKEHGDLAAADNAYLRHDYWHPDALSGLIHCRLRGESEFLVGAGREQGGAGGLQRVRPYQLPNGDPALPGSSLRGMISSLVETLSQSALRVLTSEQDSQYSVRKPVDSARYMKLGMLIEKDDGLHICPMPDTRPVGDYSGVTERHNNAFLNNHETFQMRSNPCFVYLRARDGVLCDTDEDDWATYTEGLLYLRATEQSSSDMPNKKRELFVPLDKPPGEPIKVAESVVKAAEKLLKENPPDLDADPAASDPQFPKGYQHRWHDQKKGLIRTGDLIYYRSEGKDADERVVELSYSSIWRRPVGSPRPAFVRSGGENSLPWHSGRSALTPAEALFGAVEDAPALGKKARHIASRVRFGDATVATKGTATYTAETTLKILASPKPPAPAMYFHDPHRGGFVAKNQLNLDRHVPNGRKVYPGHPQHGAVDTWSSRLPESEWKPEQQLRCAPLARESEFEFDISYENLSRAELGLLLTALCPGPAFVHRLGLGKPLGLGHVHLEVESIECIDRRSRYRRPLLGDAGGRYRRWDEAIDTSLVDAEALRRVLEQSEPAKHPVRYPFSGNLDQGLDNEDEGFVWFGENEDLNSGQQTLHRDAGRAAPLRSTHPRLLLPREIWRKPVLAKPWGIKQALNALAGDITIHGISKTHSWVYLASDDDIDKLTQADGSIVIRLGGKSFPCKARREASEVEP